MGEIIIPDYSAYETAELFDVRARIRKENNPECFAAVEAEIIKRTGLESHEIEKQINLARALKVVKKKSVVLQVMIWSLLIFSGGTIAAAVFATITSFYPEWSAFVEGLRGSFSPLADFILRHYYIIHIPAPLIASAYIFFGIGMLKRWESARENMVYLLWFSIFWNIVYSYLIYSTLTVQIYNGYNFPGNVANLVQATSGIQLVINNIFMAAAHGYCIYKFSSHELRREFN